MLSSIYVSTSILKMHFNVFLHKRILWVYLHNIFRMLTNTHTKKKKQARKRYVNTQTLQYKRNPLKTVIFRSLLQQRAVIAIFNCSILHVKSKAVDGRSLQNLVNSISHFELAVKKQALRAYLR